MESEIWKDIKGYEGLYQVSSLGRVKSLGNNQSRKEKILKPGLGGNGYLSVALCKDKKPKTFTIHQLVAIMFLGYKPNGRKLAVDHGYGYELKPCNK